MVIITGNSTFNFSLGNRPGYGLKLTRAFGHVDIKTAGGSGSPLEPVPVLRSRSTQLRRMKSAVGTQSSFKIASQNSSSRPRELRKIASQSSVSTLGGGLGAVVGRVRANSAASKAAQLSPADAALRQMLEARPSVQVLPRYVGGAQKKFNNPELVRFYLFNS